MTRKGTNPEPPAGARPKPPPNPPAPSEYTPNWLRNKAAFCTDDADLRFALGRAADALEQAQKWNAEYPEYDSLDQFIVECLDYAKVTDVYDCDGYTQAELLVLSIQQTNDQSERIEQLEAALTKIRELPMHDYCTTLAGYAGAVREFAKEALGSAGDTK